MCTRLLGLICVTAVTVLGQQSGRMIVTAEPKDNHPLPVLERDDISVQVANKPAQVVSWTPFTGAHAGLQLYIVIDDADSATIGTQFGDLKNFINSQPPTTQIGIAYLRYGSAQIAQAPTSDHASAIHALRIPLGEPGIDGSPYIALQDLVKKWPATTERREILAIMSGIDPYYTQPDMFDPYLTSAIAAAQKANIVVSSIYYSSQGHFGHSFFRVTWGQNYLSMLDDNLGGEFYWEGTRNPVAFQPFLTEFANWLNHQYSLEVRSSVSSKPELQPVRVSTEQAGVSLVTASKIYLDGTPR